MNEFLAMSKSAGVPMSCHGSLNLVARTKWPSAVRAVMRPGMSIGLSSGTYRRTPGPAM